MPVASEGEPFQRAYLVSGLRALGRESEAAPLIEQLANAGFKEREYIALLADALPSAERPDSSESPTFHPR